MELKENKKNLKMGCLRTRCMLYMSSFESWDTALEERKKSYTPGFSDFSKRTQYFQILFTHQKAEVLFVSQVSLRLFELLWG